MIDYGSIITGALSVLVQVLLPVLLGLLISFVTKKAAESQTLRASSEYALMYGMVSNAVSAAEQIGLTSAIKMAGADKKKLAVSMIEDQAKAAGLTVDLGTIDALVEGILYRTVNQIDKKAFEPITG